MNHQPAIAAILAGGLSTRMGSDKALLPLAGKPLIAHVVDRLRPEFHDIVIIGRNAGWRPELEVPCIPDLEPGKGPLSGLFTALCHAGGTPVFLVGCDMPFVSIEVVRFILDSLDDGDVAVPEVGGWLQPLHAAYNGQCIPIVEQQLAQGVLSIQRLIKRLEARILCEEDIRPLDPDLKSFCSLNHREEYEQIASERHPEPFRVCR